MSARCTRPSHAPAARRLLRATLVLALIAPVAPAAAQLPREYRYDFTVTKAGEPASTGTVYVAGDRWRIDFAGRGEKKSGDYLLSQDGGRTVTIVHPDERSYSVHAADDFERIVSRVMRGLDAVMTLQLHDAKVAAAALGAGEAVAGRPTQRYRLTQEYVVSVGMFGFSSDKHERVVTEYWVDPTLALPHNPVVEMMSTLETALAQHDDAFVRRSDEARRKLFRGVPLKVVVTAESTDEEDDDAAAGAVERKVRTIQLGEVQRVAIEPPVFQVPAGFKKQEGEFSFSL
jgi:hypothetical protein